jgi:hypothetical protein
MVILIKGMKIYSCRLILIAVQYNLSPCRGFALQDHGLIKNWFPQLIKKTWSYNRGGLMFEGGLVFQ